MTRIVIHTLALALVSGPQAVLLSQQGAQSVEAVTISFDGPQTLALGEPFVVRFRLVNMGTDVLSIDMGEDLLSNFRFDLLKPNGARISAVPQPRGNISALVPPLAVKPGATYVQDIAVAEWLEFDQVGVYELIPKFSGAISMAGKSYTHTIVPMKIEITPRDDRKVAESCERLAAVATRRQNSSAMVAARALAYSHSSACLRPLMMVAQGSYWQSIAIEGIARIPGAQADAALAELAKSNDREVAAIARFWLMSRKRFGA